MRNINFIKSSYLMILFFLFASATSWGQTVTIFSENIGTGSGTLSISETVFQNSNVTITGDTDTRATIPSTGYSGASGERNVWFASGNKYFQISGIDTSGHENITLSFGALASNTNSMLTVQYSTDNGQSFTTMSVSNNNTANKWFIKNVNGNLPSVPNLILKFSKNNTNTYRLDDIVIKGTVSTPVGPNITTTGTVSGLSYAEGSGPSNVGNFTASGSLLDGSTVTVTAPTNFEVSTDGVTFGDSQEIEYTEDEFTNQTISVRLKAGLTIGNYSGNVTIDGGGISAPKTIAVSGAVVAPPPANDLCENATELTVNGGIVNGTMLNATVSSPFSTSGTYFNDVWYKFTALIAGSHTISTVSSAGDLELYIYDNSTITCANMTSNSSTVGSGTSSGVNESVTIANAIAGKTYLIRIRAYDSAASTATFTVDLTGPIATPTIFASTNSVNLTTEFGQTVSETLNVTSVLLTDDITVTLDGNDFSVNNTTLPLSGGSLNITYNPTTVGNHTGTITLSSPGASDVVINLNGSSSLGAPTAIAATEITHNKFKANWEEVVGADGYEVIVSKLNSATVNVIDEDFSASNGSGGNDGGWSGSVATVGLGNSYPNWSFTAGFHGDNCIKLGSSSNQGSATTPEFGQAGNATVTFRAGAWNGSSESTTLKLEITGGGTLSNTSVTLVKGSFSNYTVTITGVTEETKLTFKGNTASNSRFFLDDVVITMEGVAYVAIPESPFDTTDTSLVVSNLEADTNYAYNVIAKSGETSSAVSNTVSVTTLEAPSEIIWDGTAWSNEVGPNENDDVIIDGALSLDGDLEVKNITVSEDGSIVVNAGVTLTVNGAISNLGTADQFTVESDGNLLQTSTDTNLGDIVVKRVSEPMVRLNYAMWSSPVAGQNILAFSPETVVTRFYTYEGTATFVTVNDVANKTFDVARGYLIRTPNTWWENDAPVAPQTYLGQFVGTPNNGTQTLAIHADSYTSVGNPYPSNIKINEFFEANTGIGTIYLWKNNAPTETYGDAGGQYLTINKMGDTNGNNIETISVGQGFIVSSENGTEEVVFTNEMRTNASADFHSKGTNGVEAHRMWVSLNDENSTKLNQILVGYASHATNDIDANYDSKLLNPSGSYIYSNINEEAYAIQGRALPFDAQDVVALGVNIAEAGRYTISLNSFDGLFADGDTTIFLKDKSLDVVHNLMESAYTFEAVSGVDNTRFEIIYTTEGEMGVSDLTKQAITIYAVGNDVNILSKDSSIKSVQIFDMQGRNIHNASKVNANQLTISTIAKGVLVVKVETANGKIYNQKVIVK